MSSNPTFAAGTLIGGKWHRRQYRVERVLGEGANGRVYLVSEGDKPYAMKMGFDTADHQSEINALTALSRSGRFRHFLRDVDDYEREGKQYPFYVMRWIRGEHLAAFIEKRGQDWVGPIGRQLLLRLDELHASGWIFGDLKLDNVLAVGYGEIELVDFGGATQIGRAVRQFTEMYDRGHWGAGMRTADPAYDLFAFAIMMLQLLGRGRIRECFGKHTLPQHRTLEVLLDELEHDPGCARYRGFLQKALHGEYATAGEALGDWRKALLRSSKPVPAVPIFWLGAGFVSALLLFVGALIFWWK